MDQLPPEVVQEVFSYLNPTDLSKVANVCKFFNQQANDNYVWRQKFYEQFYCYPPRHIQSVKDCYREFEIKIKEECDLMLGFYLFFELEIWCRSNYRISNEDFNISTSNEIVKLIREIAPQFNWDNLFPIPGDSFILKQLPKVVDKFDLETVTSERGKKEFSKILNKIEKMRQILNSLYDQAIHPEITNISSLLTRSKDSKQDDLVLVVIGKLCKVGAVKLLNIIFHKYPQLLNIPLDITYSHAISEGYCFLDAAIRLFHYDAVKLLIDLGANLNNCQNFNKNSIPSSLFLAIDSFNMPHWNPHLTLGTDAINNVTKIINLLLEKGADPDLVCGNFYTQTPSLLTPRQFCEQLYPDASAEKKVILKQIIEWKPMQHKNDCTYKR